MLRDRLARLVLSLAHFADCPSPLHTGLSPFGDAPSGLGDGSSRFHAAPARFDTGPVELDMSSTARHSSTENGGGVLDSSKVQYIFFPLFPVYKKKIFNGFF